MLLKEFFLLILFLYTSARIKAYNSIGDRARFSSHNLSGEEFSVFFSKLPYLSSKYSVDLKPESFYSRTSSLWLIRFYSSKCSHSKLFEPYWIEATKKAFDYAENSNFYFGNVDCFLYEKLCSEFGIKCYPKILLFEDGQLKEEFKLSDISEENIHEIISYMKKKTEKISLSQTSKRILERSVNDLKLRSESKRFFVNPNGKSIDLTPEMFSQLIHTGKSGWFIKYILPYCPYCKEMEGDWIRFASYMKGLLNIGEIDCSKYPSFCKKMGISGVPMMFYYKGNYNIKYIGPRKTNSFRKFAQKVFLSRSALVQNFDTYSKYSSRFLIFFIYFYHQLTPENIDILDWMSIVLIGKAPLLRIPNSASFIKESSINTPSLLVFREGITFSYPFRDLKDLRNKTQIFNWMRSSWLLLFPELTRHNFNDIMRHDFVILVILYNTEEYKAKKQEIKDTIYTWKTNYSSNFTNKRSKQPYYSIQYAWVNAKLMRTWLHKAFGIKYGKTKVIILKNDVFWDKNIDGLYIQSNKKDILRTLNAIMQDTDKIKPSNLTKQIALEKPRPKKSYYYVLIIVFIITTILLMISLGLILKKIREKRQKENGKNEEPLESRFE
ncbi:hypothetical protein PNEG_00140 [Pneumocystis murina B123]|uniref:Thioredoxin domain-containing protein n=1 Tax=Pneumocystis murina (strain B123) TaxID=1069680 RepID=M7NX17_PNEMU|nr:hypothetical protein PNEG_00140 [Pneumocystis murina B123]EMR11706.1 hypothetical protein PNEG_00140 [Pneumocystis murina B123]